jgi:hypothetical protein
LNNYIIQNNLYQFTSEGNWLFLRDTEDQRFLYQVTNVPHTFLVDRDLNIIDDHLGLLTKEDIINWINSVY